LWPLVSLISLTLVPVERRMVFGSIIGVGWGIFLSLMAGGKRDKTE
jgi:protein Mpv17